MIKVSKVKYIIKNITFKKIMFISINKIKFLLKSKEYKRFINYFKEQDYKNAITIGNKLEKKNDYNSEFFKIMGMAYKRTSDYENGSKYMKKSLELHLKNKNEQRLEFKKDYNVESNYVYLGGGGNLGQILHIDINNPKKEYITIITLINRYMESLNKREVFFNECIRVRSKLLEKTTPALISKQYIENDLLLLTFEKKGESLNHNLEFKEIVKLNKSISDSLTYDEVFNLLKKTHDGVFLTSHHRMHEKSVHVFNIEQMREISEKLINIYDLSFIIDKLDYFIFDLEIYNKIIPKDNYVLCHGDFGPGNITYDINDGNYYLIDWETYGLGLKGIDLTQYIIKLNCNFNLIKRELITLLFNESKNYTLEKFFFVYKLINHWILKLTKLNAVSEIENNILPAFNYLEELALEII